MALNAIAEHKYSDLPIHFSTAIPMTVAGFVLNLTGVPQGTSDVTRVGDKCLGTSLELRLEMTPPVIPPPSVMMAFRVVVFIWKDDTTPTGANILQSTNPTEILTTALDHDLKIKRKVLHDQVYYGFFNANPATGGGVYNPYTNCKIYIPLTKIRNRLNEINFIGGATPGINHIYAVFYTPVAAVSQWEVNGWSRYNFTDM